jgi:hypothetical protein
MTATALLLAGTALAYAASQSPDTEQDTTFLASNKGTAAIFVGLVAMVLYVAFVVYRYVRARMQARAATPKVPASADPELGDTKAQMSPSPSTAPTEVGSPDTGAMLEGKQLSKAVSTASTASGW